MKGRFFSQVVDAEQAVVTVLYDAFGEKDAFGLHRQKPLIGIHGEHDTEKMMQYAKMCKLL